MVELKAIILQQENQRLGAEIEQRRDLVNTMFEIATVRSVDPPSDKVLALMKAGMGLAKASRFVSSIL